MTEPLAVERRHLHNASVPSSVYVVTRSSGEPVTFTVPEKRSLVAAADLEMRGTCPDCAGVGCPECGMTGQRDAENGDIQFQGTAAVFDKRSQDLGGFTEFVARGAFRKALDAHQDVRALFNHDPNLVLGRTKNNTLDMREDPRGLRAYFRAADTSYARDIRTLVKRGDIDQMSFAFTVDQDRWEENSDGQITRTILQVRDLYDVSIVTYPAYSQTDASARELDTADAVATAEADSEPAPQIARDGVGGTDAEAAEGRLALHVEHVERMRRAFEFDTDVSGFAQ